MFQDKEATKDKSWYGIWLCNGGDWELVQIDDFLPCADLNSRPMSIYLENLDST